MTKSEQKLFDIIVDFITKNKYPPTVRELCRLTGYRSTSTIQYKLKSLKEEGLIDFVANGKRTIKIIMPLEDSDFQEVKYGKWEDKWNGKFANPTYICSVCKESALLENYIDELFTTHQRQKLSLFCPSCGAKMGDDKNE